MVWNPVLTTVPIILHFKDKFSCSEWTFILNHVLHCHFKVTHIHVSFFCLFIFKLSALDKKKPKKKQTHPKLLTQIPNLMNITGDSHQPHISIPTWIYILFLTWACNTFLPTEESCYCHIYWRNQCSEAPKLEISRLFMNIRALLHEGLDWHWKPFQLQEQLLAAVSWELAPQSDDENLCFGNPDETGFSDFGAWREGK